MVDRQCRRNRRKREAAAMELNVKKFTAKPVVVEAVLVTEENMEAVAQWSKGVVCSEAVPATKTTEAYTRRYVKPKMYHAPIIRNKKKVEEDAAMTKGYAGKWIVRRGSSFKVYSDQSLVRNYTDNEAIPLAEQNGAEPALFNGMVAEMTRPARETHLMVPGHETTVFVTPPAGVPMRQNSDGSSNMGLFVANVPTGFEKPGNANE